MVIILKSWIKGNLYSDETSLMMPFFVLNDWRHYRVHRDGDGTLLKNLRGARASLGMEKDDDNDEKMYDLLLTSLTRSCRALSADIVEQRSARGQGQDTEAATQDGVSAKA